ncbi:MAG: hypothetical protein CMJ58_05540 [Planctomycetaceae bacterium]|nr:hypothetical protein [Planctomycetaceae bacterium]
MKKLMLSAVAAGLALSLTTISAAQNPHGANAARYGVAVVDVTFIFKEYPKFKSVMDGLKKEMENAETALKADRNRLKALQEQRDTLNATSDEFKQLDEQLARQQADFQIKAGKMRRDIMEREAKVYLDTYREVSAAVRAYATSNNIGLVIRFNGEDVNSSENRQDVLRAINQPIVFQNSIDITPDVLGLLSRGGATAARPAARR